MLKRLLTLAFAVLASTAGHAVVPDQALTFKTNINIYNATTEMEDKLRVSESLIKRVIATDEFRDQVINHTYNGVKTFVDNGGYTNEEIYQKILDAAERLNGIKDNEMDLDIEMYYEYSSTVGYTNSSSPKIYANTKFYDGYTAAQCTGNMTHEWLHKLGFSHATYYSTSRDYSVPYAIGYIMRTIAAKLPEVAPVPEPAPVDPYITAATNLSISNTTSNVTLKWDAATSDVGISTYKVYRRLEGSTTAYYQGSTSSLTYTQTRPSSNATYYVKAVDKDGKTMNSSTVQYIKLTAPTNLTLSKTTTSVVLKWTASKSSAGVKEYKIYRRLYGSSTYYYQGTTTSTSWTQTKPTKTAYYYVKAYDVNGEYMKSSTVTYTK